MKHVRLVSGMARVTGTDLVGAARKGELTQEDWAKMVQSCRRCDWADRCEQWLTEIDTTPCAPDTCANRARFEALRADQKERSEAK
ncbi:DUF6455 family protein [Primorskyibacter sp. S87]|uniref:DUF6455 family protein n=1 Tax=Primorskyibacter sp. S87 TaxID=3415126 RepID=UPI003C7C00BB